eukprot:6194417-Pleurochrysis_carterae.AAC.1
MKKAYRETYLYRMSELIRVVVLTFVEVAKLFADEVEQCASSNDVQDADEYEFVPHLRRLLHFCLSYASTQRQTRSCAVEACEIRAPAA